MNPAIRLNKFHNCLERACPIQASGKVTKIIGLVIEAQGPASKVGTVCDIFTRSDNTKIAAEVLGFGESGKGQAYVSYIASIVAGFGYFLLYAYIKCSDMEHGKEAMKCYVCGFLQGIFFGLGAFLIMQKHIIMGIISWLGGGAINLVC